MGFIFYFKIQQTNKHLFCKLFIFYFSRPDTQIINNLHFHEYVYLVIQFSQFNIRLKILYLNSNIILNFTKQLIQGIIDQNYNKVGEVEQKVKIKVSKKVLQFELKQQKSEYNSVNNINSVLCQIQHNNQQINDLKLVHTNLVNKYCVKFCFFFTKPISQAIVNDNKSSTNLLIKDIGMYCDDAECLNRMYHYFNAFGKQQIYDRIRLIGGFYQDSIKIPEYPLMVVTNTTKLFKARQRRLRKMIASDCSSDESQQPQEEQQSFQTSGFLHSISKPESQLSMSSSQNIQEQSQIIYDSEPYTIYADSPTIYETNSLKMKKNDLQQNLAHLVCDFNDVDVQKTLADFQRIKQIQKGNEKSKEKPPLTLNSLTASKPVFKSIIFGQRNGLPPKSPHDRYHTLNNQQENIHSKKQKKSRGKYYERQSISKEKAPTSRQKIINQFKGRQKNRQKQVILPQNEHDYRNAYTRKTTERTQQQKARKQMVREKALRLLNRVSSEHYMKGKYDFSHL